LFIYLNNELTLVCVFADRSTHFLLLRIVFTMILRSNSSIMQIVQSHFAQSRAKIRALCELHSTP